MANRPAPIPLTVLTGFLGAGKTTVMNHLLGDPALADTVVIVNEFGEIGLDHLLVEQVADGMILLAAGCLCCTVRGDLVNTLEDLLRKRDNGRIAPFRRVVIETTGLADPAPVLAAVLYHPYLSMRYALQGVVTVVDAVHGEGSLARHPEALRQAAIADRIVISKGDLAGEDRAAALEGRLAELNPAALVTRAIHGAVPADAVLGGLFDPDGKPDAVRAWLGAEKAGAAHDAHRHAHAHGAASEHHHHHDVTRHDERIRSVALVSESPLRAGALDMFLDLLRETCGPKLLRLKGLVATTDEPSRPLLIHGVQHAIHVPALLPAWPDPDHRSRLVVILDDMPVAVVTRLWDAFSGRPGVDAADAAALTDNPLAPATLGRA